MHPIRKNNRLADFDYSQPGAYFITVCTQNRKYLLSTIVGADDHIGPYEKNFRKEQINESNLPN